MPVEFLTDDEAAAYGRYAGAPSQADLDRVFFLMTMTCALIDRRRGEHMKLGFALQLVTVRWLGMFLEDPLGCARGVLDFVAEQLGITDPSQVKKYTERAKTKLDHQWEIRRVTGWKEFSAVEEELRAVGGGPVLDVGGRPEGDLLRRGGLAAGAEVLLPGVTTLARLVAQVRDEATDGCGACWRGCCRRASGMCWTSCWRCRRARGCPTWSGGARARRRAASGPTMIKALDQVAEMMGLGLAELGAEALVPPRRLGELAKYGMRADASQIRRHPDGRRLATLLATVRHLEAKSVDDTLELLDLLMATELLNKAQTAANKEKIRAHPKLAKASARLAVAVEALFEADSWGGQDEEPRVAEVWEAIEAVISRAELRAALVLVNRERAAGGCRRSRRLAGRAGRPVHHGVGIFEAAAQGDRVRRERRGRPGPWRRCRRCRTCWPTAAACPRR